MKRLHAHYPIDTQYAINNKSMKAYLGRKIVNIISYRDDWNSKAMPEGLKNIT